MADHSLTALSTDLRDYNVYFFVMAMFFFFFFLNIYSHVMTKFWSLFWTNDQVSVLLNIHAHILFMSS